jgi:secreted trypsin-like serine protease
MSVRPETYNSSSMSIPISSKLTIAVLVLATIMVLALTASIALLFTIGKPDSNANNANPSSTIYLAEPCECGCPAISPQLTSRIVNGEAAVPNSWPWQLLLVDFSLTGVPLSYCGASLITPRHVLTAAHCVFGWSPRYVGVFPRLHGFNISSWNMNDASIAERIYVHESYDDATLNDDVAVIKLRTPISTDERVSLVCLAPSSMGDQDLKEGEPLVATGWGAMEFVNRTRPTQLQQVRLQYVPQVHPLCTPLVGSADSARPGQMCAGFPPRAVCFGDSGGPLVRSIVHSNGKTYWQQVGIMSGTVDCGNEAPFPDVYARVSYYNSWILDKIRISS